ncbi:hypothetical protein PISMIDRAFT_683930 [Pisolithus microcarpus 441]|uniref:Unplaced genomic scaffold scaffold_113, whole genome shotgun sequence n=1 Tax=Pisolithus microcarpus 441 TaxID=765257 RepID=A0A0C9YQ55_9AGAM|nr:hypothetical protein PISMIDRAFT_683930 [Pisolithus microcarpus 441]
MNVILSSAFPIPFGTYPNPSNPVCKWSYIHNVSWQVATQSAGLDRSGVIYHRS